MKRTAWAHVKQHTDKRWGVSLYTNRQGVLRCMGTIGTYLSWEHAFRVAYHLAGQERWVRG